MSWKTDVIMLGGLGVGAYLVLANADKIGAWLSKQIPSAAAADVTTAGNIIIDTTKQVTLAAWNLGAESGAYQLGQAVATVQGTYLNAPAYQAGQVFGTFVREYINEPFQYLTGINLGLIGL